MTHDPWRSIVESRPTGTIFSAGMRKYLLMKRLLLFVIAACIAFASCNNNSATGNGSAIADTVQAPPVDSASR